MSCKTPRKIATFFLISGYLWNLWYPINKALWTSSFVLVTAGWATFFLSIVYHLSDVKKIKFGSLFKYAGTNSIAIYFVSSLLSKSFYLTSVNKEHSLHSYLYSNVYENPIDNPELASFLYAITVTLCYLLMAYGCI